MKGSRWSFAEGIRSWGSNDWDINVRKFTSGIILCELFIGALSLEVLKRLFIATHWRFWNILSSIMLRFIRRSFEVLRISWRILQKESLEIEVAWDVFKRNFIDFATEFVYSDIDENSLPLWLSWRPLPISNCLVWEIPECLKQSLASRFLFKISEFKLRTSHCQSGVSLINWSCLGEQAPPLSNLFFSNFWTRTDLIKLL